MKKKSIAFADSTDRSLIQKLTVLSPEKHDYTYLVNLSTSKESGEILVCVTLLMLLTHFSEKLSYNTLLWYSDHACVDVRNKAKLVLLKRFPKRLGYRTLIDFLKSDDNRVLINTETLLYELDAEDMDYQVLINALKSENPKVCEVITVLLRKFTKDQLDCGVLKMFLRYSCIRVRTAARRLLLVHFPQNVSCVECLECFESHNGFITYRAQGLLQNFTICQMSSQEVLPLMKHKDYFVRAGASAFLLKHFPEVLQNWTLFKLSFSHDEDVRSNASTLLLKRIQNAVGVIENPKKCV